MKFKAKGQEFAKILDHKNNLFEDAGRGKTVVIGGDNLPFPVGIGLTDLPNIGGTSGFPRFRHHCVRSAMDFLTSGYKISRTLSMKFLVHC